jgi:hypothetical protein
MRSKELERILDTFNDPDGMITLWTIQREEAWKCSKERGILKADGRRIWKEFVSPYRWMARLMKERLANCKCRYPIWAWCKKPDLRHSAHLPKGTKGVCLRIRVPISRVLLSDFGSWHLVLSKSLVPLHEKERENSVTMQKSWELIFDLRSINRSRCVGPISEIQATLPFINPQEVLSVKGFRAR